MLSSYVVASTSAGRAFIYKLTYEIIVSCCPIGIIIAELSRYEKDACRSQGSAYSVLSLLKLVNLTTIDIMSCSSEDEYKSCDEGPDDDDDEAPVLGKKGKVQKRKRNRNQRKRKKLKDLPPEEKIEWARSACAEHFNDPEIFNNILTKYQTHSNDKSKEAQAKCDGIIST